MNIEHVTDTKKRNDGVIELTLTDPLTGETSRTPFLDIRGGISWPTPKAPAYFCLIGQEYIEPPNTSRRKEHNEKGKQLLLTEYEIEQLSMDQFYSKLTSSAVVTGCRRFYADLPDNRYEFGYLQDLNSYAKSKETEVYVAPAHDADEFILGAARIKGTINKGEISFPDNTIIHAQLSDLVVSDLEDKPEEKFHAINGVRHVLASYHRRPAERKQLITRLPPPRNWRVM
ncbi:hypothetical protein [Desulfogranum marinum]|uniref:hypothetical protein n=1 Tax=Desulfogranum marinum TaxID=453220 RepID=UPI0019667213|nr:hypothetical protein [Desulfogranum marinum]MBM9515044.1 hypothetical protein [Desulfogranum marinum]